MILHMFLLTFVEKKYWKYSLTMRTSVFRYHIQYAEMKFSFIRENEERPNVSKLYFHYLLFFGMLAEWMKVKNKPALLFLVKCFNPYTILHRCQQ